MVLEAVHVFGDFKVTFSLDSVANYNSFTTSNFLWDCVYDITMEKEAISHVSFKRLERPFGHVGF